MGPLVSDLVFQRTTTLCGKATFPSCVDAGRRGRLRIVALLIWTHRSSEKAKSSTLYNGGRFHKQIGRAAMQHVFR